MLVIPLDFLAFKAGLHQADWLPKSARARIIIWEYTAERVLENPCPRHRRRLDPAVKAKAVTAPEKPEGFVFRRTTGQHAHDLFLQSWYELGLFGTILVAIAGAAAALRLLALAARGASLWRRDLHPVRRHRRFRLGHVAGLAGLRHRASAALSPHAGGAAQRQSRRGSRARVSMTRDKLRGASAKRMPKDARLIEAWPGRRNARGHETLKETSMQKYLIAGLLVAGMVSPAFAAEFYVAQSATTA